RTGPQPPAVPRRDAARSRTLTPRARIQRSSPRQILRHPRGKMDKENQPETAERKHAGDPGRFLARPISLASYPVATGRPLPGPRARVRVIEEVNAGGINAGHQPAVSSVRLPAAAPP